MPYRDGPSSAARGFHRRPLRGLHGSGVDIIGPWGGGALGCRGRSLSVAGRLSMASAKRGGGRTWGYGSGLHQFNTRAVGVEQVQQHATDLSGSRLMALGVGHAARDSRFVAGLNVVHLQGNVVHLPETLTRGGAS